jgi:hypothetical protein
MQRFGVSQFDRDTFIVIDRYEHREVCVCGNYQEYKDAEKRARQIANALNREATHRPALRKAKKLRSQTNNPNRACFVAVCLW